MLMRYDANTVCRATQLHCAYVCVTGTRGQNRDGLSYRGFGCAAPVASE